MGTGSSRQNLAAAPGAVERPRTQIVNRAQLRGSSYCNLSKHARTYLVESRTDVCDARPVMRYNIGVLDVDCWKVWMDWGQQTGLQMIRGMAQVAASRL